MTRVHKFRLYPVLRWVSFNFPLNPLNSPRYSYTRDCFSYFYVYNHYRIFGNVALNVADHENDEGIITASNGESKRRIAPTVKREAQSALFEYLYFTRSLPFLDAEHMSKNSPRFLRKLLENVGCVPDVRRSMVRFLRYHPINEFEPFFESIGLEPSEFIPLLPRGLMFLSDEGGLLDNYHVLCEFGVDRNKIGKIFREARDVFWYNHGILQSKLRAFEELGIGKHVVGKAVSFNPYLLIGGMSKEFFEVVQKLKCLGYEYIWVEQCLVENASYNWRQIVQLLSLLNDLGCSDEEMKSLIGRHPEILFDDSGRLTFSLIGFLLKFGSNKNDLHTMFSQFPQVKVGNFVWNLRRVSNLLCKIDMDAVSIGMIIRIHFAWMGTRSLKSAKSLKNDMNTGKKSLCDIILENPMQMKNWTLGAKIERLPADRKTCPHREKTKFLLSIGFSENSKELEKALKVFRGKGEELCLRFDCLVQAGLSEKDTIQMIRKAPHILTQPIESLEAKINLLVNDLGYPVSAVKPFPNFFSFAMYRVKLRFAMYKWLVDQKAVSSTVPLGSIIGCLESTFVQKYVNEHPKGSDAWQEFKQSFSSQ